MENNFKNTETNINASADDAVEIISGKSKNSKSKTPKKKTAVCPVISVLSEKRVVISFNDFGLIVNTEDKKTKFSEVEIEYSGTIGKDDFNFKVTKCIQ